MILLIFIFQPGVRVRPLIRAPGRHRQMGLSPFDTSLVFRASFRTVMDAQQSMGVFIVMLGNPDKH